VNPGVASETQFRLTVVVAHEMYVYYIERDPTLSLKTQHLIDEAYIYVTSSKYKTSF
jgi:hypothetical protein